MEIQCATYTYILMTYILGMQYYTRYTDIIVAEILNNTCITQIHTCIIYM